MTYRVVRQITSNRWQGDIAILEKVPFGVPAGGMALGASPAAEINTGESTTQPLNVPELLREELNTMRLSGFFGQAEEFSEVAAMQMFNTLMNAPLFESWLRQKVRRNTRLRPRMLKGEVVDFSPEGKVVQLNLKEGDVLATETAAGQKYVRFYEKRIKGIYAGLREIQIGKIPEEIQTYLDSCASRNKLSADQVKELLGLISNERIRIIKGAYFVDIDRINRQPYILAHQAQGLNYGSPRIWLGEYEIITLSDEAQGTLMKIITLHPL